MIDFDELARFLKYKSAEDMILGLLEDGYSLKGIAERLGVARATLYDRMDSLGIPRPRLRKHRSPSLNLVAGVLVNHGYDTGLF